MMIRLALAFTLFATALLAAPAVRADAPVVVELFTSQGCSSCPPADAYLGELARDETLLALSIHVDYWDYIGWKDPFADPAHTTRQQKYKHRFGTRYIYTPQMVIDGRSEGVGSKRSDIRAKIEAARAQPKLNVGLAIEGDRLRVTIPADAARTDATATVWLIGFDARHDTPIRRGENGGKTLSYFNVVRSFQSIGVWRGGAFDQTVAAPPHPRGIAVIVQHDETGPVLGAAHIRPENR